MYKRGKRNVLCGVLQGSIQRPVIFLVYMNDLERVVLEIDLVLLDEDITLLKEEFEKESQSNAYDWFEIISLCLNWNKTKDIIISRRQVSRLKWSTHPLSMNYQDI